jgi:hypothetical protein
MLGVTSPLPPAGAALGDGWDPTGYTEGLRAGSDPPLTPDRAATAFEAIPPEQLEALLQSLGMAYGCPTPLWMWPAREPPAPLVA